MTTLNIGGNKVKVSDDFLSLSSEDQEKTVQDISRSMGLNDPEQRTVGGSIKHAASGVVEGVASFLSLPSDLISAGAHALRDDTEIPPTPERTETYQFMTGTLLDENPFTEVTRTTPASEGRRETPVGERTRWNRLLSGEAFSTVFKDVPPEERKYENYFGTGGLRNIASKVTAEPDEMYDFERNAGNVTGQALPLITGVGALGLTAKGARIAAGTPTSVGGKIGQAIVKPHVTNPIRTLRQELTSATTAGLGSSVAKEATDNPVLHVVGEIAGGLAPALSPTAWVSGKVAQGARALTPTARADRAERTLKSLVGSEFTERTARNIAEGEKVVDQIPGFNPSLGEVSGSPAFLGLQKGLETGLTGEALEEAVARPRRNLAAVDDYSARVAPTGTIGPDQVRRVAQQGVDDIKTRVVAQTKDRLVFTARQDKSAIGQSIREGVIEGRRAASERMGQVYNDLGLNDFDLTDQFEGIRESLINTMTPSGRFAESANTPSVVGVLRKDIDNVIDEATTLNDLKDLREIMQAEYRSLVSGPAPDLKTAGYLAMGLSKLDEGMKRLDFGDKTEAWLEANKEYFETVINRYDRGAALNVTKKNQKAFYVTDDEKVASSFFGPNKETDMRQFNEIFGNDAARQADMKAAIIDDFTAATVRDGVLKPSLAERWLTKHDIVLDQLPDVRAKFSDLVSAQKSVTARNATLTERERGLADTALSYQLRKFGGQTKSGTEVIQNAMKSPLLMQQLKNRLRNNPEALSSLQRHVWDTALYDTSGQLFQGSREAMEVVLGKDHIRNIETILSAYEMVARSGIPTSGGVTNTGGLFSIIEDKVGLTTSAMASRSLAVQRGQVGTTYIALEGAIRRLRKASSERSNKLLKEVLYDPEFAKQFSVLAENPSSKPALTWVRKYMFTVGMDTEESDE